MFLRPLAVFFLKTLFRMEIKGKSKIPKNKTFILASNHLSFLDPIVLGVASPRRIHFLAKEDLFKNKLFASLMGGLGAVPLKRDKPDISAMRAALTLLIKEKKPLMIFPQGKRGNLEEAKAGVGFLFRKTNLPLVVAKISGTGKILPKGKRILSPGKIKVIFDILDDICPADTYENISWKVLEKIKKLA